MKKILFLILIFTISTFQHAYAKDTFTVYKLPKDDCEGGVVQFFGDWIYDSTFCDEYKYSATTYAGGDAGSSKRIEKCTEVAEEITGFKIGSGFAKLDKETKKLFTRSLVSCAESALDTIPKLKLTWFEAYDVIYLSVSYGRELSIINEIYSPRSGYGHQADGSYACRIYFYFGDKLWEKTFFKAHLLNRKFALTGVPLDLFVQLMKEKRVSIRVATGAELKSSSFSLKGSHKALKLVLDKFLDKK